MDVLVRYFHFLSIILLCGSLMLENALLRKEMPRSEIGRLALVDMLFGMSAVTVLMAGFLLWFRYGKGAGFYAHNPVFYAKLALFLIVGLLSIVPTVYFAKQRKGDPQERVSIPARIGAIVKVELAIVLFIPLLAVLMAKGIGLR